MPWPFNGLQKTNNSSAPKEFFLKHFFPLLAFSLIYSIATGQTGYWQQQADYSIDVSLDDKDNALLGFEKVIYTNNSPDTLHFIWFHLWPNAYKNDRTDFARQNTENGYTDFYFSDEDQRGYINQLDFKADGITARTEADSNNIDILKVFLPIPLAPGGSVAITTPFHVKLPLNVSRGGYVGQTYQVTQWYPKPAVYDSKGWHPMPYLDQGEFYSDFGNFSVNITLPENYVVAASGVLNSKDEFNILKLKAIQKPTDQKTYKWFANEVANLKKGEHPAFESLAPASSPKQKTLNYTLERAHDFAWFASKLFIVQHDTLKLENNTIDVFSFYNPWQEERWKQSLAFVKSGTKYYSSRIGTYPYPVLSVVAGSDAAGSDGMEYPTIALITSQSGGQTLDATIAHEIGHNWFYGMIASNERDHPWMDEGINTFYQESYEKEKYKKAEDYVQSRNDFIARKLPNDFYATMIASLEKIKKDQPIDMPAPNYTDLNYGLVVYEKTARWMHLLESRMGSAAFDSSMRYYFNTWKYRHPSPEDFRQSMQHTGNAAIDSLYPKLFITGPLDAMPRKRPVKLTGLFNLKETDKYHYISVLPAFGYNMYDYLMAGVMLHNYQLPVNNFNFLLAPMYATQTKELAGAGRMSYSVFKKRYWLETSVSGTTYSIDDYTKDDGSKVYLHFNRIVPSVKLTLYNKDLRSHQKFTINARTFLLNEDVLQFSFDDTVATVTTKKQPSYVNQLTFAAEDNRKLYPYSANITVDQGKQFIRAGFTGKMFFNYQDGKKGMQARFFAGKFFYTQDKTIYTQFQTDRYQLNMTGPKGYEDYTFSNYFVGRNEFEGWQSQQISERDGFFKVRTDLLGTKVGKSDDWLMALNFSADIPDKINPLKVLPFELPLKVFADFGTYSEAWKDDNPSGSFLYDAGIQLSLLKGLVNIYAPIFYSKVYGDYFKSTLGEKRFLKTLSFDINLQVFKLNNLFPEIPL